jgi:hypothetical protein
MHFLGSFKPPIARPRRSDSKMNFKFRTTHFPKKTLITAVSLIAFTGLLFANAGRENVSANQMTFQTAEIKRLSEFADLFETENEMKFIQTLGDLSEEELIETLAEQKWKFTYLDGGGLDVTNPFCERFIDKTGSYGIYGKIVADYLNAKLKTNRSTPMLADDLVGMEEKPNICPNWRAFDNEERIRFWVWTFAAMSAIESSCGAHKATLTGVRGIPRKDSNGKIIGYKIAIGLLQMEKDRRDRYWRGPTCNVSEAEITQSFGNLRCGIDIMEGLVSGNLPKGNPKPIYRGVGMPATSYWWHLNHENGGQIGKLIRSYTPCSQENYVSETEKNKPVPVEIKPAGLVVPIEKPKSELWPKVRVRERNRAQ